MWFEDEAFFGRMSNPVPCWAPPGVRPVLPLQRQREYRNVFGALCPASGAVFTRIAERNNAELMSAFLAELSASRKESRMAVFLDGASWHKSKDLAIPDNIVVEVLPPTAQNSIPPRPYGSTSAPTTRTIRRGSPWPTSTPRLPQPSPLSNPFQRRSVRSLFIAG